MLRSHFLVWLSECLMGSILKGKLSSFIPSSNLRDLLRTHTVTPHARSSTNVFHFEFGPSSRVQVTSFIKSIHPGVPQPWRACWSLWNFPIQERSLMIHPFLLKLPARGPMSHAFLKSQGPGSSQRSSNFVWPGRGTISEGLLPQKKQVGSIKNQWHAATAPLSSWQLGRKQVLWGAGAQTQSRL